MFSPQLGMPVVLPQGSFQEAFLWNGQTTSNGSLRLVVLLWATSLRVRQTTLRRKLILYSCICLFILSVTSQFWRDHRIGFKRRSTGKLKALPLGSGYLSIFHSILTWEQDPEIFQLFNLGQWLNPNQKGAMQLFLTGYHGLRLRGRGLFTSPSVRS